MNALPRRSMALLATAFLTLAGERVLRSVMAEGEVAHALLGAGNAMPSLGVAVLAGVFVLVRVGAYVLAPGLLLAGAAGVVAHVVVGPSRPGDQRAPASGSSTKSGTGISVAAGTGTSIGGRGTV